MTAKKSSKGIPRAIARLRQNRAKLLQSTNLHIAEIKTRYLEKKLLQGIKIKDPGIEPDSYKLNLLTVRFLRKKVVKQMGLSKKKEDALLAAQLQWGRLEMLLSERSQRKPVLAFHLRQVLKQAQSQIFLVKKFCSKHPSQSITQNWDLDHLKRGINNLQKGAWPKHVVLDGTWHERLHQLYCLNIDFERALLGSKKNQQRFQNTMTRFIGEAIKK